MAGQCQHGADTVLDDELAVALGQRHPYDPAAFSIIATISLRGIFEICDQPSPVFLFIFLNALTCFSIDIAIEKNAPAPAMTSAISIPVNRFSPVKNLRAVPESC